MPHITRIFGVIATVIIMVLLLTYEPPLTAGGRETAFQNITREGGPYPEPGAYSGHTGRKNYTVTNENDWRDLWEQHNSVNRPVPALPKIDFEKEMVIAVFQGQFPTGGYSIEIKKIREYVNRIEVVVQDVSPGEDCRVTEAFSSPFHIVKLEKSVKRVDFIIDKKITEC